MYISSQHYYSFISNKMVCFPNRRWQTEVRHSNKLSVSVHYYLIFCHTAAVQASIFQIKIKMYLYNFKYNDNFKFNNFIINQLGPNIAIKNKIMITLLTYDSSISVFHFYIVSLKFCLLHITNY